MSSTRSLHSARGEAAPPPAAYDGPPGQLLAIAPVMYVLLVHTGLSIVIRMSICVDYTLPVESE